METDTLTKKDSFSFWKNIALITVFFAITPIVLGTSLFSLITLTKTNAPKKEMVKPSQNLIRSGIQVYASLPSYLPSMSGEVFAADARNELIRQFLESYASPLEPYADFIVGTSDKYGLDWRLTTAIAMKESGLGKIMPSKDCNNAWGYGIHSKGTLCFDSWEEGIETVSKGLKENYLDQGYTTIEEIMAKYTPLSAGTWAEGVTIYMNQMQ